ncbi:FapA family protein [Paenibacillus barcinonensis]|uniref:FapA family protein n=1 Tax=Paenibacillus barcinonensis TaxID=198119 RepID=A0A2V4WMB7_PAEBA|nr:FapA family protein [Paenibacillus barcinonensis]PYE48826.1 hypothetical protein DFQ00_107119 [Paenibacillus barcinonensis]QKS57748.1 FapA family protein [Paenibacillus barcinonensis]
MGKKVVAKGRSIQEAVAIALDLLGANKNDVDIEILENERKGLLGMMAKPAVVQVTTKHADPAADKVPPNEILEQATLGQLASSIELLHTDDDAETIDALQITDHSGERDLAGMVWVQDGMVFSESAEDKFPVIAPGEGVTLLRNGQLIEGAAIVYDQDQVTIEIADEVVDPFWEITLSEDRMEARLFVKPGYHILKRILDKDPSNYVLVEMEEKRVPTVISDIEVMSKLRQLNVVHGIEYDQIANACFSETEGTYVIARGTPYTVGKHGYFMPLQQTFIVKGVKERSDGTVDYRHIQEFPSVDRGQIIGVAAPPEAGYPGITVTNEPVLPPEVYPVELKAGIGVELADQNKMAVALDAGHPDIQQVGHQARISIIPRLTINKDIDLETGNIDYIGNIEILGSVQDGMTVQADGNIFISNHVNMSTISAGQSVIIEKNIISSVVTAGKSSIIKLQLQEPLQIAVIQMRQMTTAIQQLSTASAFKASSFERTGLGPLLKILYDGKFKALHNAVTTVVQTIDNHADMLGPGWKQLRTRLEEGFLSNHFSNLNSAEDIIFMITAAEELLEETKDTSAKDRFIRTSFVHNSQLYCSGDILVTGKGLYNSKVHASGLVEVKGYVRGGEIYAEKGAIIDQAGTKGGTPTRIRVPEHETIRIGMAMQDTRLQIGSAAYTFTDTIQDVVASVDSDGRLILY